MKQAMPEQSDSTRGTDDRPSDASTSTASTTPDGSIGVKLSRTAGIVLMMLGAIACAAAGIGGLLIGFRFFTNP